ncbi:MAG: hypothetical protein RIQ79_1774 [Verrucomicrobiota bacterium]
MYAKCRNVDSKMSGIWAKYPATMNIRFPLFLGMLLAANLSAALTPSYDSVRGKIAVAWERDESAFSLHVTIPVNATGTVYVPTADTASVTEGERKAANAQGVTFLRMESGSAVFEIVSGSYSFNVSN